jgi:hypothetical protein
MIRPPTKKREVLTPYGSEIPKWEESVNVASPGSRKRQIRQGKTTIVGISADELQFLLQIIDQNPNLTPPFGSVRTATS